MPAKTAALLAGRKNQVTLSNDSSQVVSVAGFPWESEHASFGDAQKYANRCRAHGQTAGLFAEYENGASKQRHVFKSDSAAHEFKRSKSAAWKWGVIVEGLA